MAEIVGASFTELTVRTKFVLVKPKLVSLTEIVMLAVPNRFAAGVTVTVRLLPLPPKTMLDTGARTGLDDCAASTSRLAGVVSSPIVNGMAGVGVSSAVVRLAMAERLGAALAKGLMCTTKLWLKVLLVAWPSVTVTVIVAVPDTPLTCR